MNYLYSVGLSKTYGDRVLFKDISLSISKGQKVALIARNGSGKTSLLDIIAGREEPDSGSIELRSDIRLGFLSQDSALDKEATVLEAIFQTDNPVLQVIKEYEHCLLKQQNSPSNEQSDRLQKLMEEMDRMQAWDYEVKVKEVLSRLDIFDMEAKIGTLSGGQVKRVSLAAVLIQEPDFMIMDEPTNHLDIGMIEWLEKHLSTKNTTLLLVSHDRYFLDAVCDEIVELENTQLYRYKGNYNYYLEKKAELQHDREMQKETAVRLYRKELDWMRRQPQARGTKAKARISSFYSTEEKAKVNLRQDEVKLDIKMERIGSKILEFKNVRKAFGEKVLIDKFTYKFKRFERVGIVGVNGSGKTTLLNMIMGNLKPDTGKITLGETVKIGYYKQENSGIKGGLRVMEAVREVADFIRMHGGQKLTAHQLLERFLFSKEQQQQFVHTLSGGEKRRLHLLRILMENPNFLILDEPTNDLDLMTLNVLEDFLVDFKGILLVVTHDRYFMDKLVDHLFVFEGNGAIRDFPGNYSHYRTDLDQREKLARQKSKEAKAALAEQEPERGQKETSRAKKLSYNEQKEYKQLGRDVEKLEAEKKELEAQLAGELDHEKLMKMSERLGVIIKEIDEKGDRWLELSEFI